MNGGTNLSLIISFTCCFFDIDEGRLKGSGLLYQIFFYGIVCYTDFVNSNLGYVR